MADRQKPRFSAKWDTRTGSPRKLWRALHDFLDDHGFQHEYEELRLEGSPIEGTATFSNFLSGFRDLEERLPSKRFDILFGILLCLTIFLIPFGILLLKGRYLSMRIWVTIDVEGEVYRTRGADIQSAHAAEILDVVADTRISLEISAGVASKEDDYKMIRPAQTDTEISRLEGNFAELKQNLDDFLRDGTLDY